MAQFVILITGTAVPVAFGDIFFQQPAARIADTFGLALFMTGFVFQLLRDIAHRIIGIAGDQPINALFVNQPVKWVIRKFVFGLVFVDQPD